MKNIIEYKDEYASSINNAILRCLSACTSTNDKEGFLSLIYYLKKSMKSKCMILNTIFYVHFKMIQ